MNELEAQIAMMALNVLIKWGPIAADKFLGMFKPGVPATIADVQAFIDVVRPMDFWAISGLSKPVPVPIVTPIP